MPVHIKTNSVISIIYKHNYIIVYYTLLQLANLRKIGTSIRTCNISSTYKFTNKINFQKFRSLTC